MISRKCTGEVLKGKKVHCDVDMRNGAGCGVSAGTIATIKKVVRGKGLTIQTEKCPCCGQYAYITGVPREKLTLVNRYLGGRR